MTEIEAEDFPSDILFMKLSLFIFILLGANVFIVGFTSKFFF